MIDVIFALLILLTTLTSTFDLLIQTSKFKDKTINRVEITLEENMAYEESIQDLF
ncbi:hypothetical protein [Thiospirochaeta perfilievii]|uniref:hypothetical protein n=1 Tax=Thiospirochaeta perfilievii TaxID=252967 RepID=UPI001658D14E|nr:hypothetical protein [Thiospirochaeta perfilievii]